MNTQHQVAAVKNIIKIKNRILHSSDWDEITNLMQDAIDACAAVPANHVVDPLDRTKSKEWNVISVKRLINSIKEKSYPNFDAAFPEIATSLLRLAMVFVSGGLEEVNRILAESLSTRGLFETSKSSGKKNLLSGRSN
ncbi:MAG: hypothetical protein ABIT58_11110 [Ferruginibacter sp.]